MCFINNISLCRRLVSQAIASLPYVPVARVRSPTHLCKSQLFGLQQQPVQYQQPQQRRQLSVKHEFHSIQAKNMSTNAVQNVGDVKICVIKPQDRQRVLDFLRLHYYREEPLTVGTEPQQQDPADEEFNMSNIEHGTCLMAVHGENETIVGAVLAGPKGPHEADHLFEDAAKEGSSKWGVILKFLACVERDANVCPRYGVEKVLHAHVLGVDSKTRGKNIGSRLLAELKLLGKQLNYELLAVDCTSYYSAMICDRLGWDCVNTVYYKDYLDENQCQVFHVTPPHDCCKTFAVRL